MMLRQKHNSTSRSGFLLGAARSRRIRLLLFLIVPCLLLGGALLFMRLKAEVPKDVFYLHIEAEDVDETVYPWFNGRDCTVFLPACAEGGRVSVQVQQDFRISVGEQSLNDGDLLDFLSEDAEYEMRVRSFLFCRRYRFRLLRSSGVRTMFIDTESGSMKNIHADKTYKEQISMRLIGTDGAVQYQSVKSKLNGRGNSTWKQKKKPYTLTLPEPYPLLGAEDGKKWVLLANALDESNLRNKLIFDFASDINMEWVPDCDFVELYLNREYAGLYLLTEQINSTGPEGLQLSSEAESAALDFLCKTDEDIRYDDLNQPFYSGADRAVEITWPKKLSTAQKEQIAESVQIMEDAILSEDEAEILEVLDLESWAKKYLIDEVFANPDADRASSYFYCRHEDGRLRFYAGPLWDYDVILGREYRSWNPDTFIANTREERPGNRRVYYYALYRNPYFYEKITSIYRQEFLPLLQELTDGKIAAEAERIAAAANMNQTRWFQQPYDLQQLVDYLEQRIAFLNSAWIEHEQYCSVLIVPYRSMNCYMPYAVKPGDTLPSLPILSNPLLDTPTWIDADTGAVFDPSQPIVRDTALIRRISLMEQVMKKMMAHRRLILIAGILVLGLAGALLMRRRRKKKTAKNTP